MHQQHDARQLQQLRVYPQHIVSEGISWELFVMWELVDPANSNDKDTATEETVGVLAANHNNTKVAVQGKPDHKSQRRKPGVQQNTT